MATIGDSLLLPQSGWRRYQFDSNSMVLKSGYVDNNSGNGEANGGLILYSSNIGNSFTFTFYGVQLLIRAYLGYNHTFKLSIDGVEETVNIAAIRDGYGMVYEKLGLSNTSHKVTITNLSGLSIFDSFDIDSAGYLTNTVVVGQQLLTPEAGWARYEESDPNIAYYGTWTKQVASASGDVWSGGYCAYTASLGGAISFRFTGTKFRLIGKILTHTYSTSISVYVDGNKIGSFSQIGAASVSAALCFELLNLELKEHAVLIMNDQGGAYFLVDAIDVDSSSTLSRYTKNIKNSLQDMEIGDCIPCRCKATTANVAGIFSELGTCVADEIPIIGSATPDGLFYFRKVDKGLLIADRVVQTGISWDALNSSKYIQVKLVPDLSDKSIISPLINSSIYEDVEVTSTAGIGWQAFALNPTFYSYPTSNNFQIVTKFKSGKVLNKLILNNLNYTGDGVAGPVGSFKLYGSFNGIDFVELLAVSGIPNVVQKLTYTVDNTVAYTHYKFNVLSVYGNWAGNFGRFGLEYYNIVDAFAARGAIRSLSGGNAHLGDDGKASFIDKGLGAWPANNEWDKYIVNSDLNGNITPGDNTVWHCVDTVTTWAQDTVVNGHISSNGTGTSSWRTARGDHNAISATIRGMYGATSSSFNSYVGFRPVLEYPEDSKCTNLWH